MRTSTPAKAILALCLTVACTLSWTAIASARLERPLAGWFGPSGPEAGEFTEVQSVATDAAGNVYVYDSAAAGGSIYKFDSSGNPVNFTALGANVITGVGGGSRAETEIAVSPAGPTAGDIYVARGTSNLEIYGPDGSPLGSLAGGGPGWGGTCGVATAPSGDLYVSLTDGYVDRYVPSANPAVSSDYTSALYGVPTEPCNVAVDANENVYEVKWQNGPVTEYALSQFNTTETLASGTQLDSAGSTLAVDQSTGEIFIDEQHSVTEFNSTLEPVFKFGEEGLVEKSSLGIAAAGAGGDEKVYLSTISRVDIFSPILDFVPTPPSVNDQPPTASHVEQTSVVLSGTVNPKESDTKYHFVYGTSEAYGSSTSEVDVGKGSADVSVGPAGVTDLQPETTYHYALVASNEGGTATGTDHTFTTGPLTPPVVSTGTASVASPTSVTISGTVDPKGLQTSYEFQLGETAEYGGAQIFGNAGEAGGEEPVSTTLDYLVPGTTYHYRVVATNVDGTTYGADLTFTTPGVPSPISQLSASPLIAFTPVAFPNESEAGTVKTVKKAKKKAKAKHLRKKKHGEPKSKSKKKK